MSDQKVIEFSEVFNINDISPNIWNSIIERSLTKSNKNNNHIKKYKTNGKFFKVDSNQDFKYLTDKTNGNIHDNGTIEVTTNSFQGSDPKYHPKNLLNFNESNFYIANGTDAWICFDFKKRKIKLTNYQIKSYDYQNCHLKSWIIEISNDGINWRKIDERVNCPTLNGRLITGTFEVQQDEFSRYVRLYQTDIQYLRFSFKNCETLAGPYIFIHKAQYFSRT